jgi:hypothetical protein
MRLPAYVPLEGDLVRRDTLPDSHPESWPSHAAALGTTLPDNWRSLLREVTQYGPQ